MLSRRPTHSVCNGELMIERQITFHLLIKHCRYIDASNCCRKWLGQLSARTDHLTQSLAFLPIRVFESWLPRKRATIAGVVFSAALLVQLLCPP